jgi:hypothetical protein
VFEKRCTSGTERLIRPHSKTITAKSAPHPLRRVAHIPVRDGYATSTEVRIPAVCILRHHVEVKVMLKDS